MKILLIAMPDVASDGIARGQIGPNLALSSLAGNIDGCEIQIADLVLKRKHIKRTILKIMKNFNPDIVGLSAMTFQYDTAVKISALLKGIKKEIKIVIGGYHASLMYKEIADTNHAGNFDFIVRGEGEFIFRDLLNGINQKLPFEDIKGLSFKRDGVFIHNPPAEVLDLNNIRLPNRGIRIFNNFKFFGLPADMIESSRGCGMDCKFCCIRKIYGRKFRTYKIERIIKDIEEAKRVGTRFLFFVDDNATMDGERFKRLCEAIIDSRHHDMHFGIQASVAGIASKADLPGYMAKAGFKAVFLGFENALQKNLDYLEKKYQTRLAMEVVNSLRKRKIIIYGGFIIGNPNDTEEDIIHNFEAIKKMKLDSIFVQFLTPYPYTQIQGELEKEGLITGKDYSKYTGLISHVRTKYLSTEELEYLKWKYLPKTIPHNNFLEWWKFSMLPKVYPGYVKKEIFLRSFKHLLQKRIWKSDNDRFTEQLARKRNLNGHLL
jgi:radical SAM superfamily enzyme YgiQ (UPF0313 family)